MVLDYPANTAATRRWFRSIFEQAQSDHLLHFVQTPNQVCIERIAKRKIERSEGSHHLAEEQFTYISSFFEVPEVAEGFNVVVYSP